MLFHVNLVAQDVFEANITHDLIENGDSVSVTQENKQKFVDLYAGKTELQSLH